MKVLIRRRLSYLGYIDEEKGWINPFASIRRTGTSKGKVKVRVICLDIFDLIFQFFHSYMKKSSKSSLKRRSLDTSLHHKN